MYINLERSYMNVWLGQKYTVYCKKYVDLENIRIFLENNGFKKIQKILCF